MKKVIAFILLFVNLSALAETENVLKLKYGWNQTLDPYMSPLRYEGEQIGLGNEWWNELRGNWNHVGQFDIVGQRAYSSARSNRFYGIGIHGGWGAHYGWTFGEETPGTKGQMNLFVGPYLDIDIMARQHASEVNKPYSADVAIDAMAMAGISGTWRVKNVGMRLRYIARTNLIGTQFQPEYWQSYYEIYENGLNGTILASGPWNRNRIWHELTFDISGNRSTWRIGAEHEFLRYGNKNTVWTRNQVSLVIGCIWKYKINGKTL